MEPRGKKLIARYKRVYSIPIEANITERMILDHWNLEKQLTSELRQSNPESRWATFDSCYTRLYTELDWLNQFTDGADSRSPQERFGSWLELIGPPPKRIYEIGSGKGGLISFLADLGYDCRGTEITRVRGEKLLSESPMSTNLSWGISDGVHLDRFEPPETYDVVVSDQVIEHLHPDDLESHLRSVQAILRKGGRYIFNTPNSYTGPHDVSRVFNRGEAEGMHLKEYTCREMIEIASSAGFGFMRYGLIPRRFRIVLTALGAKKFANSDRANILFLRSVLFSERIFSILPPPIFRPLCVKLFCALGLFSSTISLVAEK